MHVPTYCLKNVQIVQLQYHTIEHANEQHRPWSDWNLSMPSLVIVCYKDCFSPSMDKIYLGVFQCQPEITLNTWIYKSNYSSAVPTSSKTSIGTSNIHILKYVPWPICWVWQRKMTPHPSVREGWGALLEWDLRPRACMTLAINLARNYLDALLKILNLEYIW